MLQKSETHLDRKNKQTIEKEGKMKSFPTNTVLNHTHQHSTSSVNNS